MSDLPASIGRPTWAEIDLDAIVHNFDAFRAGVGPDVGIMGIVKADAYGHGAVPVARTLAAKGVSMFGVAIVAEAAELRQAGIRAPIQILGPLLPEEIAAALELDCALTVSDAGFAREIALRAQGRNAAVHLKINTGMGRLGVAEDQAVPLAKEIVSHPELSLAGVMTHFPSADDPDRAFTERQIRRFRELCDEIRGQGIEIPRRHAANSAGVLRFRESYFDMIRPGISMYGLDAPPEVLDLRPAMTLKTRVAFLREARPGETLNYGRTFTAERNMRVAVIPIGYEDGFNRRLSNRGAAIVRGRRVRIVGRVCMDQTLVDVTDVPGVELGDEVVLYGRQNGETIRCEEVAELLGTIANEIVCAVGRRVPRVYLGGVESGR